MAPYCVTAKRLNLVAREIRFAVGSKNDLCSSVWRLWSNKNNLFLAARTTAGLTKISFHESGICRHAVVSQAPRAPLSRWTRPERTAQGVTPVFDLIVPAFSVERGFRDVRPPTKKTLELIDIPVENTKRIIRIFLSDPDFSESDVLKISRSSPLSFHGYVRLLREKAWVVSYSDELKLAEWDFLDGLVSKTSINLEPGSSADAIQHACMHIFEKTAPPRIIDVQLGPGNVHVKQA